MAKSRLTLSIPTASVDSLFHGRYPNGDAPRAQLAGAASDAVTASALLGDVTSSLVLTNTSLPSATQQVDYQGSVTLVPAGGTAPYTITLPVQTGPNTFSVLQLSPGVTPWIVGGVPQFAGVNSLTFQVNDAVGNSIRKTLTITTVPVTFAIITDNALANAIRGILLSGNIVVRGGVPPYLHTPSAISPNTGNWLRVNADGTYGGTPGTDEVESFTDTVTDSSGGSNAPISKTFSLAVVEPTLPTFDRFIGPNGDDHNDGLTPSTAWSITAFNSQMAGYAGKKIGIIGDQGAIQFGTIGGVQTTLFAMIQAAPSVNAGPFNILITRGGPNGANPTYIASCNSAGVYTARAAIIDCANPANGALPTNNNDIGVFGQNPNQPSVGQFGNITFDGITVRNFPFTAISLFASGTPMQNAVVKNNEVYNGGNIFSNDNPGAIWLNTTDGATILNNKVHDCATIHNPNGTGEDPGGMAGIITFNSTNLSVKYNATWNVGAGCYLKDNWQSGEIAYNYFELGVQGSYGDGTINGSIERACPGPGMTLSVHHNICSNAATFFGASNNHFVQGTVNCFNNTFYGWSNNHQFQMCRFQADPTAPGTLNWYNNLVFSATNVYTDPGAFDVYGGWGINGQGVNYNCYTSALLRFGTERTTTPNGPAFLAAPATFGAWQAVASLGLDAFTTTISTSPFVAGVPTARVPSSFAINPTHPAFTAGTATLPPFAAGHAGAISGACDQNGNAADGSGRIGPNF